MLTLHRSQQVTSQTAQRCVLYRTARLSPWSLIARQVYISSRDAKACENTAKALTDMGPGSCHAIPADLASYDECKRLVEEMKKREKGGFFPSTPHPRIPLIPIFSSAHSGAFDHRPHFTSLPQQVNNSGVVWGEELEKYPDAAFTKLLTLNVQRVFTLTQLLVPFLRKAHEEGDTGRVINVSRRP